MDYKQEIKATYCPAACGLNIFPSECQVSVFSEIVTTVSGQPKEEPGSDVDAMVCNLRVFKAFNDI